MIQNKLQDVLTDLVALSLDGKQLHWHVTGPLFKPVHEQLDDVVTFVRTASDVVAERAVALGHTVDARPTTVAKEHQLPEAPAGWVDAAEAVRHSVSAIDGAVERARQAIDDLAFEPVTQDLLIGIVAELEKQRWLLAAQVR